MDTTTTVYTLPNCVQCVMTKRALDASGIEYDVVDLTKDDQALEAMRERGFTAAPIVTVEPAGIAWSGFQPDRIADLSLELEQQEVATC